MVEFWKHRRTNSIHTENVKIVLRDGTTVDLKTGFSTDPNLRARSAQSLLDQYPDATSLSITGNKGEDWGTYER